MRRLSMFLLLILISIGVHAESDWTRRLVPIDTTFLTGELDNGMKYYIKKNQKPEGVADFYIARSVGAMQEDDHQTGLAHFLEHMAFNGTKNLPGKAMLNYLQSIGAEFGRNINAYTGMDQTVYILNDIPLRRQAIIDSALLILYDWSRNISLVEEEVNKERGVIIEELRGYNSADFRNSHKSAPYIYNGTKYKDRDILGTEEQLRTFKQEDIESFYAEWYRPEYQAIIAVGDFDPVAMENEIIEMFSKLKSPENVRDKAHIVVPTYKENVYTVITDPENTTTTIQYFAPFREYDSNQNRYYGRQIQDLLKSVIVNSMNERLSDISRKENPPFISAYGYSTNLAQYTDYMCGMINVEERGADKGLEAFIAHIERMRKYGVTEDELSRQMLSMHTALEAAVKREADKKTSEYVQDALADFLDNSPIMTPSEQLELFDQASDLITLELVNSYVSEVFPDVPGAIIAIAPDKEGAIPTVEGLKSSFEAGKKADLPPLEEGVSAKSLITNDIKAGSIVNEGMDDLGNIVWTLSNGATMILHPTKLKQDEVILSGSGYGGESYLSVKQLLAAELLSSVASESGLGDFSASDLKKVMTGKRGGANVGNSELYSTVSGSASSKMSDLEVMFQQLYLRFQEPRFEQTAFNNTVNMYNSVLLNYEKNPDYIFQDTITYDIYGGNPRKIAVKDIKNNINTITLDDVKDVYSTLHQGVNGYRFVMVGNFVPDSIRGYVEKYVASINSGEKRSMVDNNVEFTEEDLTKDYYIQMEEPKSVVAVLYEGDKMKYNLKNSVTIDLLNALLRLRYTEIIREEKGASYGVSVSSSLDYEPRTTPKIVVQFNTNAEQASEMADIVAEQIELIADGTINQDDFNKTIASMQKSFELREKENGSWMSWINTYHKTGIDYHSDFLKTLGSISEKDVIRCAKDILKDSVKKRLIMYPKAAK